MKIHVLSDLHLEVSDMPDSYQPPDCDVVVLAGDICNGTQEGGLRGLNWAAKTFSVPIIMVAGNHSFYGCGDMNAHILKLQAHAAKLREAGKEIHFLERGHVVIDGVYFLGCTMWTDFNLYGNRVSAKREAFHHMNDYHKIRVGPDHHKLNPAYIAEINDRSFTWLKNSMGSIQTALGDVPMVVVTHHAPSPKSIHPKYGNDPTNVYYASDYEDMIREYKPNLWVHGHMHDNSDYTIDATRVVANPRGYAHRLRDVQENEYWNPRFIVEV